MILTRMILTRTTHSRTTHIIMSVGITTHKRMAQQNDTHHNDAQQNGTPKDDSNNKIQHNTNKQIDCLNRTAESITLTYADCHSEKCCSSECCGAIFFYLKFKRNKINQFFPENLKMLSFTIYEILNILWRIALRCS